MAKTQFRFVGRNKLVSVSEFQQKIRGTLCGKTVFVHCQKPVCTIGVCNGYGQCIGGFVLRQGDFRYFSREAPRAVLFRRDAATAIDYGQIVVDRAPLGAGRFEVTFPIAIVKDEQIAEEQPAVPQEQIPAPEPTAEPNRPDAVSRPIGQRGKRRVFPLNTIAPDSSVAF